MNIYLINRADRPERKQHAMEQLKNQNLNAHLIPATISKVGWHGCRNSHLNCLVKGFASQEPFIVFEDDILFLEDFGQAQQAYLELPNDWDILYLGGSPNKPQERYSSRLFKADGVLTTHAMMWNPLRDGALDYCLTADDDHVIEKWDVFLRDEIQPRFNCFLTKPMIVTQKQFQSDTCKRSDVSTIEKNYNRFCK